MPSTSVAEAGRLQSVQANALSILCVVFLISFTFPMTMMLGSIQLYPYRLILVLAFFPLLFKLFSGGAGRLILIDWLMLFCSIWAAIAVFANHPFGTVVEAAGLNFVEFFGAYLFGRVTIRSAADFQRFARVFLIVLIILLPFAVIEGLTGRALILDLVPNSIGRVDIGERMGIHRAQSVFSHPILYGAFASTALGISWFAVKPKAGFVGRVWRYGIVTFATILSMSAGAFVSLLFQSLLIAYELVMRRFKRRWTIFAWGAAAAYVITDILATKSPFHIVVNRATFNSGSAYNRINIWKFGTDNVWQNPIFGLGFRDWVRPSYMGDSVDNYWLVLAMRYGLPEIIAVGVALFLIAGQISRATLHTAEEKACRAGYLVSFGGIVLAGATVHYWQAAGSFLPFFLGTGIWIITAYRDTDKA